MASPDGGSPPGGGAQAGESATFDPNAMTLLFQLTNPVSGLIEQQTLQFGQALPGMAHDPNGATFVPMSYDYVSRTVLLVAGYDSLTHLGVVLRVDHSWSGANGPTVREVYRGHDFYAPVDIDVFRPTLELVVLDGYLHRASICNVRTFDFSTVADMATDPVMEHVKSVYTRRATLGTLESGISIILSNRSESYLYEEADTNAHVLVLFDRDGDGFLDSRFE